MPASTGVAISSITVSAGIVTVNATAHGLAANQGFSLQGTTGNTYNFNGTVSTATANAFTFPQGTLSAAGQGSAGGTVFPAKQVIVLSVLQTTGAPDLEVNFLLWLTTKTPLPASGSSAFTNATAQEVAAIAAGWVIEKRLTKQFAVGNTKATIQPELLLEWQSQQSNLASGVQPGVFYGGYVDSVGWSF